MSDNNYARLAEVFRQVNEEQLVDTWALGTVISVSPLKIDRGGIPLVANELICNYTLLRSKDEEERLHPGDSVVLLQGGGENQVFVVLCKVVSG